MKATIKILRTSFQLIWEDLWTTLVCNWIWQIANLLVIPGPPATMALIYYTNILAHGETADLKDFWVGFKRYWKTGWKWGVINLIILFLLLGDLFLLSHAEEKLLNQYTAGLYLALVSIWLMLQFFSLPLLLEQGSLSLQRAFRNGVYLIGSNLTLSIAMSVSVTILLILGTAAFMLTFAFGAVLVACASNLTVISFLANSKQSKFISKVDVKS